MNLGFVQKRHGSRVELSVVFRDNRGLERRCLMATLPEAEATPAVLEAIKESFVRGCELEWLAVRELLDRMPKVDASLSWTKEGT